MSLSAGPPQSPLPRSKLTEFHGHKIQDNYIIIFKPDGPNEGWKEEIFSTSLEQDEHRLFHLQVPDDNSLQSGEADLPLRKLPAINGRVLPDDLENVLQREDVEHVYEDGWLHAHSTDQQDAPWGISRLSIGSIDLGNSALRNSFSYRHTVTATDKKVNVFVVGIDATHTEIANRVISSYAFNSTSGCLEKVEHSDPNGHGTHCAVTAGGKRFGIAKNCRLVSIGIFDATGVTSILTVSRALCALVKLLETEYPASDQNLNVVNMSFGAPKAPTVDCAVQHLVKVTQAHVVVAAGNNNKDAKDFSPAGVESVLTIGASTYTDTRAWFSNHGEVVDLYAPGVFICSGTTWSAEQGGLQSPPSSVGNFNEIGFSSGTSMSCAHVSGLVAYLLIEEGEHTPEQMRARVIELSETTISEPEPEEGGLTSGGKPPMPPTLRGARLPRLSNCPGAKIM